MVKQEEEKANSTRVEDAWNQYKTSSLDLMLGEKGVLKLEGGAAVNGNILQTVSRGLDARRREIESTLVNEEQRTRFRQRANVTDMQASERTLEHLSSQQKVYDKLTMDGIRSAEIASVEAQPNDEVAFRGSVLRLQGNADRYLRSKGVTDEGAIKASQNAESDTLWATRIKKLMYPNPDIAENMFRAAENQIHNPIVRDQLRAEIKNGAMPFRAGQLAEKILSEVRAIPTRTTLEPGTRTQELAMVEAALAKKPDNPDLIEARYALTEVDPNDAARGIPSAKIEAARLSIAMLRVDKEATRLYGPDVNNVDRQTFVRMLESELRQRNGQDVQQLNAVQNANYETAFSIVMKAELEGTKDFKTLAQHKQNPDFARAWDMMAAQGQAGIVNAIDRQHNKETRGNSEFLAEIQERITRPIESGGAINSWMQIQSDPRYLQLNNTQVAAAARDFKAWQDADGRNYIQRRKLLDTKMRNAFRAQPVLLRFGAYGPDYSIADEALLSWQTELADTVAKYNKDGKPIGPLFDPQAKEYVGTPEAVARFSAQVAGTTPQALSSMAAQAQATSPPVTVPADVKTPEQAKAFIDKLPPNATHVIWNGQTMDIRPLRKTATASPAQGVPQSAVVPAQAVPQPAVQQQAPAGQQPQTPIPTSSVIRDTGAPAQTEPQDYGQRADGTPKGNGFLGPLTRPDGRTSTEISVRVNIDGKEMEIPTLVPILKLPEINKLLSLKDGEIPPDDIVKKAVAYARKRIAAGKPVFATAEESAKVIEQKNRQKRR